MRMHLSKLFVYRLKHMVRITVLTAILLPPSSSFAQSNEVKNAKFYGSIVIMRDFGKPEDPEALRVFTVGLHPTSPAIAKANSCARITGAQNMQDGSSCFEGKRAVVCNNGGYYAVATSQVATGPLYSDHRNAIGITCGHKTIQIAKEKAMALCEATRKKRGMDSMTSVSADYSWTCKIAIAALNNGLYGDNVIDVPAVLATKQPGEPVMWGLDSRCWGAEKEAAGFTPEQIKNGCH